MQVIYKYQRIQVSMTLFPARGLKLIQYDRINWSWPSFNDSLPRKGTETSIALSNGSGNGVSMTLFPARGLKRKHKNCFSEAIAQQEV
jgi:hypothetical protein